MKALSVFLILSSFSASALAYPFVYDCTGDYEYTLKVESKSKVSIENDGQEKDVLKVDVAYMNANPEKKSVRLNGSASTMGDGEEGYTVYVTMSKVMLSGARFGFLNKTGYGPDGGYQESYKCNLRR